MSKIGVRIHMQLSGKEHSEDLFGVEGMQEKGAFTLARDEIDNLFQRDIYREIISSKAFNRLKNIRFLGAIDYSIYPNEPKKRHTRYQHSLGVAKLALEYSKLMNLTASQEILCVTSALLHDIGHAPLSHSLEPVFMSEHKINHHSVSEKILKGDFDQSGGIWNILERHRINQFDVMSIVEGVGSENIFNNIFKYEINIDTIEGVLRSRSYLHKDASRYSPYEVLCALVKVASGDTSELHVLDYFWRMKKEVYSLLINSRLGTLSDFICKKYMRENIAEFDEKSFYSSEKEILKAHKKLFLQLKSLSNTDVSNMLFNEWIREFKRRDFYLTNHIPSSIQEINLRYKQSKSYVENSNYKKEACSEGNTTENLGVHSLF